MKKFLLVLIAISSFAFTSFAQQEWTKIYNEGDVMIEMKQMECNPFNRMVPYTYAVLKYTNKSNQAIDFNFEIKLWYNDVLQDNTPIDLGDPAAVRTLHLNANEVKEGDCDADKTIFIFMENNNNPKMPNQLTKIEIVQK